jgi:peptide/nickel transport system permease protein
MLRRSPTALIGLTIVAVVIFCGTFAPWISPYDPIKTDLYSRLEPPLLLALAIVATLGPGIGPVMTAVGISLIPIFARVARGSVLTVKAQNYVLSARALGASHMDIMLRHILPNILTPVMVMATLYCAFAIILEAALSFLGIGIQPPEPTWGAILSHGQQQMRTAAWISTFSGLAITITVLGFNLLGDGLRDLMDPSMRHVIQAK